MFVAEYVKDDKLIRVYSENGKRVVTAEPYRRTNPVVANGYFPIKKPIEENKSNEH